MKRTVFIAILLLLVACGSNRDTVVVDESAPAAEEVSQGRPTPTTVPDTDAAVEEVAPEPTAESMATDVPPTDAPTVVPPTDVPTEEPTAPPVATPTDEPVAEPPPIVDPPAGTIVNGQNEDGTFYRGWDTAPVTMIDYSDFL